MIVGVLWASPYLDARATFWFQTSNNRPEFGGLRTYELIFENTEMLKMLCAAQRDSTKKQKRNDAFFSVYFFLQFRRVVVEQKEKEYFFFYALVCVVKMFIYIWNCLIV